MKMTFAVKNVRELGTPPPGCDSFKIFVVIGDETINIREMRISYLKELRAANKTPDDVTDVDFLLGDPQFRKFMKKANVKRIELAYSTMAAPSENSAESQRVEFPANAFEGGEVKASKTPAVPKPGGDTTVPYGQASVNEMMAARMEEEADDGRMNE